MASSAGWTRVAAGLQKVATAVAQQASAEVRTTATRTAQHGMDFAGNLQQAAAMATTQDTPGVNGSIAAKSTNSAVAEPRGPASSGFTGRSSSSVYELLDLPEAPNATAQHTPSEPKSERMVGEDSTANDRQAAAMIPPPNPPPLPTQPEQPTPQGAQQASPVEPIKTGTDHSEATDETYSRLKEGRHVPSTRVGRAFGFASLGLGLVGGAIGEGLSRLTGSSSSGGRSVLVNDSNADRLAASLCRMRGAALKMGQMLSIQDESLLPPELTRALKQVRQGADAMPQAQLTRQLKSQLGEQWSERFVEFDPLPFAAASVGQCHRAKVRRPSAAGGEDIVQDVVVKVQYPGVGNSIESDLNNLAMLVKMTGLAPKGLFLDNVIRVGREELIVECDYIREMKNQKLMKELVEADAVLQENQFVVPDVIEDLTTSQVITTTYSPGGTIDKVLHLDQEERNRIGRAIMYLAIQELFVWRFMQTDPNWGNFLYDVGTRSTALIDFGAAREYSKEFVDGYLRIVWASANQDEERLMEQSHIMKFLTGEENDAMLHAHKMSGYTIGEPFRTNEPFDFRGSKLSTRMQEHTSTFLRHRLTPPPSEVYTLHRKLAGAFMLCIKLGAVIPCRDMLEEIIRNHAFEDGQDPPPL